MKYRRPVRPRAARSRLTLHTLDARDLPSTFVVDRLTDENPAAGGAGTGLTGDLRYALTNAESGDDITFSVIGTINLTAALPGLTNDLTLDGPGAQQLAVSGAGTGGVFVVDAGAAVTIDGLTIRGGVGDGGGILVAAGGSLELTGVVVRDNTAPGGQGAGIWNAGTLALSGTTVAFNSAADLSGRTSSFGGGIYNAGALSLLNSTVANNQAWAGGAIFNAAGTVHLTSTTVSANATTGADVGAIAGTGTLTAWNTIVAGNPGVDLTGPLTSQGHNLLGSVPGGGLGPTDLVATDAVLGPLQDNGGSTPTMAPVAGSPGVNAGDNAAAPAFDQRGPGFTRVADGTIDIGAVEVQSAAALNDIGWAEFVAPAGAWTTEQLPLARTYIVSGAAAPADFAIRYYTSLDLTFGNADDVLVGEEAVTALADKAVGPHAGASPAFSITTPGTYYLFARLDSAGGVAETDEGNNVVLAPDPLVVTDPGDLAWTADGLLGPAAVRPGSDFTLATEYTVSGGAPAGDFTITYYASADTTFGNGDDLELGSRAVTAAADKAVGPHPGTIGPIQIGAAGTYKLFAKIDAAGALAESDETNNVIQATQDIVVSPTAPAVDLDWVGGLGGPATAGVGAPFTVDRTFAVSGEAASAFAIGYYRSANGVFGDGDDVLLGTEFIGAAADLAVGSHAGTSPPLTIEAAGSYFLFARLDDTVAAAETDETDNVAQAAGPVDVGTVLDLSWEGGGLTGPATATTAPFTIDRSYTIAGAPAAADFAIAYFASVNETFGDADDFAIGSETVSAPAGKAVGVHPGTSPALTISTPGTYFLFARLDDGGTAVETDEGNNVEGGREAVGVAQAIEFGWAGAPTGPAAATTAAPFQLNRTYTIAAGDAPGPFSIGYYRSTNGTFGDADDVLVATELVEAIGDLAAGPHPGTGPDLLIDVPGTYTLFARIDDGQEMAEVDESDNVIAAAAPVTVTAQVTFGLEPGLEDTRQMALVIRGTVADDAVTVRSRRAGRFLVVASEDTFLGEVRARDATRIIVTGLAGNDRLTLAPNVKKPATLVGGEGDDTLTGGAAADVLVGGAGADVLVGGGGPDVLIGGSGGDLLDGQGGSDLLISGLTGYDADPPALKRLRAVWAARRPYADRVADLKAGVDAPPLTAATVTFDAGPNTVTGGGGRDWFVAAEGTDDITDRRPNEVIGF